jgi:Spy/CpxP family protein refolding chaperone
LWTKAVEVIEMSASYAYAFFAGFITTLVLTAAVLYGFYVHSRRNRADFSKIKGYLDLIPDLSKEQREKVQEIRRVFLPEVQGIRENLRRERAELAKLLFADPPDRAKIGAVSQRILLHQSDLENDVINHILEEKELLSVSQQKRFYEIIVDQFASGGLGVHDVRAREGPNR